VLVRPDAKAKRVAFAADAPISNVTTLEAIFGVKPTYGAKQGNEIVFDRALGEGAITIPALVVRALLEKNAERALAKLPDQTESVALATRVCAICKEDPTTFNLSVNEIAKRLHMSARTLQRQLQEEGTSWAALVDQMRRDLATDLKKRGATEKEITFLLGFSDRSSLVRARARWRTL
jgi:AraC-like DNA-binding protein